MSKSIEKPSAKECMQFLQEMAAAKSGLNSRYVEWIPENSKPNLRTILDYEVKRTRLVFWQHERLAAYRPIQNLAEAYGSLLQYKLRIVWHRAAEGLDASAAAVRLQSETREIQHLLSASGPRKQLPESTRWCVYTLAALKWLERNTRKLRICELQGCREYKYFIASTSSRFYCSKRCGELAELERVRHREVSASKMKAARLSPEGRKRIADAARARWQRYRAGKE